MLEFHKSTFTLVFVAKSIAEPDCRDDLYATRLVSAQTLVSTLVVAYVRLVW